MTSSRLFSSAHVFGSYIADNRPQADGSECHKRSSSCPLSRGRSLQSFSEAVTFRSWYQTHLSNRILPAGTIVLGKTRLNWGKEDGGPKTGESRGSSYYIMSHFSYIMTSMASSTGRSCLLTSHERFPFSFRFVRGARWRV